MASGSGSRAVLAALAVATVLGGCRVTDQRFTIEPATPRLIAPISMATVTRQAPTLRWTLGPGEGVPIVELCSDRPCAMPIARAGDIRIAADGRSAVPLEDLPTGWVYWRVRVELGDDVAISPTWQFRVGRPRSEAPIGPDSASGEILDVDGDGFTDFLVGAPTGGPAMEGAAHLYRGSGVVAADRWNGGAPADRIDLINPDGVRHKFFGQAVASAGDVNGDGFADFVIGAPFNDAQSSTAGGAAYLYLGGPDANAAAWNDPSSARRIALLSPDGVSTAFGGLAAGVGDVNGDGYGDFVVGANAFGLIQPIHVYLGSASPTASAWSGGTASDRIDLVSPEGVTTTFTAIAAAGDVNGDRFADFAASIEPIGGGDPGVIHVYLGSASPTALSWNAEAGPARIDVPGIDGPTGRFAQISSAGDLNGDGFTDLVVGAVGAASNNGAAHLYLGGPDPAAAWAGAAPGARIDLVCPDSMMKQFGNYLSPVGDVNGDGLADLVISGNSGGFGTPSAGLAYVYLGMKSPSGAAWNGASPARRIDLTAPEGGGSLYGNSSLTNGDVNGDSFDDFTIGATSAHGDAGVVYVYFGGSAPSAVAWNSPFLGRRIDVVGPDAPKSLYGRLR